MANANEDDKVDTTTPDASPDKKESDETKVDDTTEQADAEKNDEGEKVDYAAELQKAQTRISQAEHTIVELRRKKEPEDQNVDEDVVDKKIDERFSSLQQQLASTAIASTLASLSSDPDERKLIMFHYQNSIKPTGITPDAILADLENAQVLANRRKLIRENSEIKRAVIAKNNSQGAGSRGTNQDRPEAQVQPTVKVTAAEAALLARRGLKPENVKVQTSTVTKR